MATLKQLENWYKGLDDDAPVKIEKFRAEILRRFRIESDDETGAREQFIKELGAPEQNTKPLELEREILKNSEGIDKLIDSIYEEFSDGVEKSLAKQAISLNISMDPINAKKNLEEMLAVLRKALKDAPDGAIHSDITINDTPPYVAIRLMTTHQSFNYMEEKIIKNFDAEGGSFFAAEIEKVIETAKSSKSARNRENANEKLRALYQSSIETRKRKAGILEHYRQSDTTIAADSENAKLNFDRIVQALGTNAPKIIEIAFLDACKAIVQKSIAQQRLEIRAQSKQKQHPKFRAEPVSITTGDNDDSMVKVRWLETNPLTGQDEIIDPSSPLFSVFLERLLEHGFPNDKTLRKAARDYGFNADNPLEAPPKLKRTAQKTPKPIIAETAASSAIDIQQQFASAAQRACEALQTLENRIAETKRALSEDENNISALRTEWELNRTLIIEEIPSIAKKIDTFEKIAPAGSEKRQTITEMMGQAFNISALLTKPQKPTLTEPEQKDESLHELEEFTATTDRLQKLLQDGTNLHINESELESLLDKMNENIRVLSELLRKKENSEHTVTELQRSVAEIGQTLDAVSKQNSQLDYLLNQARSLG